MGDDERDQASPPLPPDARSRQTDTCPACRGQGFLFSDGRHTLGPPPPPMPPWFVPVVMIGGAVAACIVIDALLKPTGGLLDNLKAARRFIHIPVAAK